MKVLHVVSDLGQGGAQSYVLDLLKQHSTRTDIHSELVALFFKGALWPRVKALNIPSTCLEWRSALDIFGVYRFYRHLARGRYDIVHVHHIHPAVSAIVGCWPSKNIYTEHGGGLLGGGWLERLVYTRFHRNYCRFIAISREMKQLMQTINPAVQSRVTVVYNGIDLERIDALPAANDKKLPDIFVDAALRIGIIGRLERQKGLDTFLEAAALLSRSFNDVVFPVIGEGSLKGALESKAQTLGISSQVLFLGFRTDAIELLKRFDILLFTSEFEPFGLVITEAMATQVPVVALHQRGAIPELINDGVEGFVVRGGTPAELAERASRLIADTQMRKRIARAARARVEEYFTMTRNADQVAAIYRRCLSAG